ncbi:MAG: hypothetical protein A3J38_03685 [Gammaproteobacteria bacterium RIFCSPHIGHO2_12_FULL_45_9]|nr:MAG: hypothetical protein A3J38_03685 [Gammaproteobacteria bacterium RIFCSPHIGHO2_12_FULL_45_9]
MMARAFDLDQVDTLVIEGCGVRFLAYIQALKVLQAQDRLAQIKRVAASSSGAMVSFLFAIGYTPEQMETIFDELNYGDLLDPLAVSKVPVIGSALSVALHHGTSSSVNVLKFIEEKLQQKGLPGNITFRELKAQLGSRDLYITGTAVTRDSSLQIFSLETTPDIPVSEAVAAAVAYPGVVCPYPILVGDKIEKYLDGGVRDNFPIDIFPKSDWPKILGLRVDTYEEIFGSPHKSPGLGGLLHGLLQDDHTVYLRHHAGRTIQIYDGQLSSTKVNLTRLQKLALKVSGSLAAKGFLNAQVELTSELAEPPKLVQQDESLLRARTLSGIARIKQGQSCFNEITEELNVWDDNIRGCYAHYHLLIAALREQSSYFGNNPHYYHLLSLLKERGAKASLRPEISAEQITDITLEYLKDKQVTEAYDYLHGLYQVSATTSKLFYIDHRTILQHIPQLGIFTPAAAVKKRDEFVEFIELLQQIRLADCSGAAEANYIIKLNDLLQSSQYTKALALLKQIRDDDSPVLMLQIAEAAQKQLEGAVTPESIELFTYLQAITGKQGPVLIHPSPKMTRVEEAACVGGGIASAVVAVAVGVETLPAFIVGAVAMSLIAVGEKLVGGDRLRYPSTVGLFAGLAKTPIVTRDALRPCNDQGGRAIRSSAGYER